MTKAQTAIEWAGRSCKRSTTGQNYKSKDLGGNSARNSLVGFGSRVAGFTIHCLEIDDEDKDLATAHRKQET